MHGLPVGRPGGPFEEKAHENARQVPLDASGMKCSRMKRGCSMTKVCCSGSTQVLLGKMERQCAALRRGTLLLSGLRASSTWTAAPRLLRVNGPVNLGQGHGRPRNQITLGAYRERYRTLFLRYKVVGALSHFWTLSRIPDGANNQFKAATRCHASGLPRPVTPRRSSSSPA